MATINLPKSASPPVRDARQRKGESRNAGAVPHAQSTEEVTKGSGKVKVKGRTAEPLKRPSARIKVAETQPTQFDPKSILPATLKGTKTLSELRNAFSKSIQAQGSHDRIDDSRESIEPGPRIQNEATADGTRLVYKPFGIEAHFTKAVLDDVCYDYLMPNRWCRHGKFCHRIHPIDRVPHIAKAVEESYKIGKLRKQQQSAAESQSTTGVQDSPPPIMVKLPALSQSRLAPHMPDETTVVSPDREIDPQNSTTVPPSRPRRRRAVPKAGLQSWGFMGDGPSGWLNQSDTSSSCDSDDDRPPCSTATDDTASSLNPWEQVSPKWHTSGQLPSFSEDELVTDQHAPSRINRVPITGSSVTRPSTSNNHHHPPRMPNIGLNHLLDNRPSFSQHQTQRQPDPVLQAASRRTRPPTDETCRPWLRNQCILGYACHFVHGDLDYDDDPVPIQPPKHNNHLARPISRPPPLVVKRIIESHTTHIHQHMRATFSSGFEVTQISTGFESPWMLLTGVADWTDAQILDILQPFGIVLDIRRPPRAVADPNTFIKVHFEKSSASFAALTQLHRTTIMGRVIEAKPGNENNYNRRVFSGNAVRFEWDVPHRTVFMGYATRELAEKAVNESRRTPCREFMTSASLYVGIPAVGRVTVKFDYLPLDVSEDDMKVFGPHDGMVKDSSRFKDCSFEDLIRGFRRTILPLKPKINTTDIRGLPYRNGKMKAWVVFESSREAEIAAEKLDGVVPYSMRGSKILARQMKSISFSLSPQRFRKVEAEIRSLQNRLHEEDNGYWVDARQKDHFFSIRISGDEVAGLGKLKAEFERIINGEQVLKDGKAIWDGFLGRPGGMVYLQGLQREHPGVTVELVFPRRTIKLFGPANLRSIVRQKIIQLVEERQTKTKHVIPIHPHIAKKFSDDREDGFAALEAHLGSGNVHLDLWNNEMVVYGDADEFIVARDAVLACRQKVQSGRRLGEVCPACFGRAISPSTLPCGHKWCRNCLQRFLKVAADDKASFPLVCHGVDEPCGEHIPIHIAQDILPASDIESICASSLASHIQTHPKDFVYCPTPDCQQVYRPTPEGISMQCPECLSDICTHCHSDAHPGLTCSEVHDGDDLFKDWATQNNVKRCPNCRMGIEKIEGCNHMTCAMCKTHICWVCMQTFKDGYSIYGHMQAEHGGSGL